MKKFIVNFAKLGSTHSYDGKLKIIYHDKNLEKLFTKSFFNIQWYIYNKCKWEYLNKTNIIKIGKSFYIKIFDIKNKELAKPYINLSLGILRQNLPKIYEGYYKCDLLGMKVFNLKQKSFGTINNILELGKAGNVISCKFNEKIYLIPFVNKNIINIDQEKKEIIVDWEYHYT